MILKMTNNGFLMIMTGITTISDGSGTYYPELWFRIFESGVEKWQVEEGFSSFLDDFSKSRLPKALQNINKSSNIQKKCKN